MSRVVIVSKTSLSMTELFIMKHIETYNGWTSSNRELAISLNIDKPVMIRCLRRLIPLGFIEANKRGKAGTQLRLTDAGREARQEAAIKLFGDLMQPTHINGA